MGEGTTTAAPAVGTDIPAEQAPLTEREKRDPRFVQAREESNGEKGREMLAHARQGAELDAEEEYAGLDWLLGNPRPLGHKIPVEVETERGMRTVEFIASRMDARRIDAIELQNLNQQTGRVDRLSSDFAIVAEACVALKDSKRTIRLTSTEFRTFMESDDRGGEQPVELASTPMALERRFAGQEGVLTFVAAEIRRLAGYDPSRVGTSQRVLVESALG